MKRTDGRPSALGEHLQHPDSTCASLRSGDVYSVDSVYPRCERQLNRRLPIRALSGQGEALCSEVKHFYRVRRDTFHIRSLIG
jgi:hypothetical protein